MTFNALMGRNLGVLVLAAWCGAAPPALFAQQTMQEQLGFKKSDVVLIVNADDVAMCRSESEGALKTLAFDLCKTGTVQVPAPDFERFAEEWAKHPQWDLGLHLCLTSEWGDHYGWAPLLARDRAPSLYAANGFMHDDIWQVVAKAKVGEAVAELEAQILKALDFGCKPTHIDGHMGSYHYHPLIFQGAEKLSRKYNLPLRVVLPARRDRLRKAGYAVIDQFHQYYSVDGESQHPERRDELYRAWMKDLKPGVHELAIHPAQDGEDLRRITGSARNRINDMEFWTSEDTRRYAEALNIKFLGYRPLQKLQARNWGLTSDGVIDPRRPPSSTPEREEEF